MKSERAARAAWAGLAAPWPGAGLPQPVLLQVQLLAQLCQPAFELFDFGD